MNSLCLQGNKKPSAFNEVDESTVGVIMVALLFVAITLVMCDGEWTQHDEPALPRACYGMAVGYYNQSIYILYVLFQNQQEYESKHTFPMISGGYPYDDQLIEYKLESNNFIDYGQNYLESTTIGNSDGEFGWGIYYTQIDDTTLYTINQNGELINVYDLQSLSFHNLAISIPNNVGNDACLSSSQSPTPRLYVTGGYDSEPLNELQILDLSGDMEWIDSPPAMTTTRYQHGCAIINNVLWAIGGFGRSSVESINITDITKNDWREIGNVPVDLARLGVTTVDDLIFIVGGWAYTFTNSWFAIDDVYTINTTINSIETYTDSLPYATRVMPVLATEYTIYGFGGQLDNTYHYSDAWISFDLFSVTRLSCIPLLAVHSATFLIL